jgi:predicted nucleotidyltransferase
MARGDARPDSDVDFLIDAEPVTSSWFPAGLVLDISILIVKICKDRGKVSIFFLYGRYVWMWRLIQHVDFSPVL